jgi:hypothetical protein
MTEVEGEGVRSLTFEEVARMTVDDLLGKIAGIENISRAYGRFILDHGRSWKAQPLPRGVKRGEMKRCFENAQRFAAGLFRKGRESWTYVEGYACSGDLSIPVPAHHAWLVDGQGTVVDPTWRSPERSYYFGVAFETSYVLEQHARFGVYGSFLDNRDTGWSLLNDTEETERALAARWRRTEPDCRVTDRSGR